VGFTGPFFFARCGSPIPAIPDKEPMFKFLLGLPHVMRGPLIDAARSLNAPVLIGANALSMWKKDARDIPVWHDFMTKNLKQLKSLEAYLDSARSSPAGTGALPGRPISTSTLARHTGRPDRGPCASGRVGRSGALRVLRVPARHLSPAE
jgi:hypothetical protein